MLTATLTWVDPTTPISGVEIAMRVQGAPTFTVLETVAAGAQRAVVPDLVDGTYEFRAIAVNGSKRAGGVTRLATVETTPADVGNFAINLS